MRLRFLTLIAVLLAVGVCGCKQQSAEEKYGPALPMPSGMGSKQKDKPPIKMPPAPPPTPSKG